ncbi:GNAT family N-acetyltransferase [Shewanella violacea]|uniref:N-acetyltransferase domain-containing protein n=1 Tax=Shewanella violacea (strain JCM 10179 / CIP 106290 / LMG 19151 / DSS12) TaxID=637905 RepID=D4ZKB6_SHEVD|nr:GNAT family N-acetyltransferase [Shewanella violacea]BAJ02115.1 hypothetical protein SVI_2144 [Shewanella violacea DSS12]
MIQTLTAAHFTDVISLGNLVHGDGYLNETSLAALYQKGISNEINANFVAHHDGKLIGFRLTYAPGNWQTDKWCTPHAWGIEAPKVCYFKCNTLAEPFRGAGIGGKLLSASIAATKRQGAIAGIGHLWKQSPNNSAVRYFTKAGATLIKEHPARWNNSKNHSDYVCVICGTDCQCTACEMLLIFK